MKLMVFGATGQTGAAVLRLAIENEDFEVSAYVRTPFKIPSEVQSKLTNVVTGDVMNSQDVSKALAGQDCVISCLGTPALTGIPRLMSRGMESIVKGMHENGIKKLAVVGAACFLPTLGGIESFIWKNLMSDHGRMITFLKTTENIDWTVLSPPYIVKATKVGNYKTEIDKLTGGRKVTTFDMADWMLSYMQKDEVLQEHVHKLVGISSSLKYLGV